MKIIKDIVYQISGLKTNKYHGMGERHALNMMVREGPLRVPLKK